MKRLISFLIVFCFALSTFAALSELDKAGFPDKNQLTNPGWESGKAGWTLTGAGSHTTVTAAANRRSGNAAGSFDASAASENITSNSITITSGGGLSGANGEAACYIKAASGTATHTIQAYDGTNVLASQTINSSTSGFVRSSVLFPFPVSGTVALRIVSAADEPVIYVDDCYLGPPTRLTEVSQATLYGSIKYAGTTNCSWTTGDTTNALTDFGADTDCPTPTTTGYASAPSTKVPRIKFASLPPGNYMVVMGSYFGPGTLGTSASMSFRAYDGTTNAGYRKIQINNTAQIEVDASPLVAYFTYTTAQTNIEFRPRAASSSNANDPFISNDGTDKDFEIQVYRFPASNETGFRPDQIAWRVDANISGANPDLGTSNQSSYTGLTNGSLTLTNNTGSGVLTAQIACAGTTPAEGTTCNTSAVNESVGISFNLPMAGDVLACADFTHAVATGAGGAARSYFQIVETPNNAQTISKEGGGRVGSGHATANVDAVYPHRTCGTFSFSSAGQKTLRLMYEQQITATVSVNLLLGDADSTFGQRDIHWTVEPLNQQVPAPLLVGSVTSNSTGLERVERATVASCTVNGACTISRQSGSWLGVTRNSAGDYTMAITSGIFSAAPSCTFSCENVRYINGTATSATAGSILVRNTTPAADDCAGAMNVICIGPR